MLLNLLKCKVIMATVNTFLYPRIMFFLKSFCSPKHSYYFLSETTKADKFSEHFDWVTCNITQNVQANGAGEIGERSAVESTGCTSRNPMFKSKQLYFWISSPSRTNAFWIVEVPVMHAKNRDMHVGKIHRHIKIKYKLKCGDSVLRNFRISKGLTCLLSQQHQGQQLTLTKLSREKDLKWHTIQYTEWYTLRDWFMWFHRLRNKIVYQLQAGCLGKSVVLTPVLAQ